MSAFVVTFLSWVAALSSAEYGCRRPSALM